MLIVHSSSSSSSSKDREVQPMEQHYFSQPWTWHVCCIVSQWLMSDHNWISIRHNHEQISLQGVNAKTQGLDVILQTTYSETDQQM